MPPDEHVVHPLDPASKEASILGRVGEQLKNDATEYFNSYLTVKGPVESSQAKALKIAERAGDFSLNLQDYWKSSLNSFTDKYVYEAGADRKRLDELLQPLREASSKLEPQLKRWEELTSPYADRYDEGAIYTAAHDLMGTLRDALKKARPGDGLLMDPQYKAESIFLGDVCSSLSGLSEQIGIRVIKLSEGEVVKPVTISAQTQEAMERARKDPADEKIADQATSDQEIRDDFQTKFTEDNLLKMRQELIQIREQLCDEKLADDRLNSLKKSQDEIIQTLKRFATECANAKKGTALRDAERFKIDDARIKLNKLTNSLSPQMDLNDRQSTVDEAKALAVNLSNLEKKLLNIVSQSTEQAANESQTRLDDYRQSLNDARSAVGKNISDYWARAKSDFLDDVEANADKKLRGTLEKAFDADFRELLSDWKGEVTAPKVDPAKVQELASTILQTTESYSIRAEGILLAADALAADADRPSLRPVLDRLNCSMTAIREAIANQLQSLLQ